MYNQIGQSKKKTNPDTISTRRNSSNAEIKRPENPNCQKKSAYFAIPCMKNWKQKMNRKANKKYFHENKRKYEDSIEN